MNAPPEELTLTRDSYDKGPGERLREARMAADLSLEEMSARLHLDRRRIEFLEADDYAQLPAPTFVRGYLRSYARLLDLPPGPIIEAFDRRGFAPPALIADIATQAETRSTDLWVVSVTVGIGTLLVVLAAVWFQTQRSGDFEGSGLARPTQDAVLTPAGGDAPVALTIGQVPLDATASSNSMSPGLPDSSAAQTSSATASLPASPTVSTSEAAAPNPTVASPSPATGDALPNETQSAGSTGVAGTNATASEPPSQNGALPRTSTESSARAPPDPNRQSAPVTARNAGEVTGAPAGATASSATLGPEAGTQPAVDARASENGSATDVAGPIDTVSMRFTREAWVAMYDGNGKRLYYNLAQPGKRIAVKGLRPIKVVLGQVRGVQVEYNGAPFDFSAYVTKGVARFDFRP